jgi:hypothetical protein
MPTATTTATTARGEAHVAVMPQDRCYAKGVSVTGMASPPIACVHCGAVFTPKRSTARYCSTRCRVAAHRLPVVPVEAAVEHDGVLVVPPQAPEPEPFSFDRFPPVFRELALVGSGTVQATRIVEAAAMLRWAKRNMEADLYVGWLQECRLTPEEADCIIFVGEGRESRGQGP